MQARLLLSGRTLSIFGLVDESGVCASKDYIDDLQTSQISDHKRLIGLLERTVEAGLPKNRERFRLLEGKIFEFKSYQDRLLCFQDGSSWIITHGCKKKKDKMDPNEIRRAEHLRVRFLEGGSLYE
jgi:Phage derived protein Gp49-like (DUF891)